MKIKMELTHAIALAFVLIAAALANGQSDMTDSSSSIVNMKGDYVRVLKTEYGKVNSGDGPIETKIDTLQQLRSQGGTGNTRVKYYCPIYWKLFNNKCYRLLTSEVATWEQARTNCIDKGGDLFNPPYSNFLNFWFSLVAQFGQSNFKNMPTMLGLRMYKERFNLVTTRDYKIFYPGSWNACINTINSLKLPQVSPTDNFVEACGFVELEGRVFEDSCVDSLITTNYICEREPKIDYTYEDVSYGNKIYKPPAECFNDLQCDVMGTKRRCNSDLKCVCPPGHFWSSIQYKCIICDSDWVAFEGRCHYVSPKTQLLDWARAEEYCLSKQASLIPIDSNTNFHIKYPSRLFGFINSNYWSIADFWTFGVSKGGSSNFIGADNLAIYIGTWFDLRIAKCLAKNSNDLPDYGKNILQSNQQFNTLEGINQSIDNANLPCNLCLSASSSTIFVSECSTAKRFICLKYDYAPSKSQSDSIKSILDKVKGCSLQIA